MNAFKNLKKRKPVKKQNLTFTESLISWVKTILGAIVVVMIINGVAIASFVVPTPSMENTVMAGDFLFVNKFVYGPSSPQVIPFINVPIPFFRLPGIKDPEKDDVIVFIFPGSRDSVESSEFQYYLKRCIATAGDTLQIKNNQVYVNAQPVALSENGKYDPMRPVTTAETFETYPKGSSWTRKDYGPIRIPKEGDIVELNSDNFAQWEVFIKREGHEVERNGNQIKIDGKVTNKYMVERNYCFGMGDNRDHSLDSRFFGFIPYENVVGTPIVVYWSWDPDLPITNIFKKLGTLRISRIGTLIN